MHRVSLVSTLHDSAGWSIEPLREQASLLGELYDRRVVVATKGTSPAVVDALESSGWVLAPPRSNVGVEFISDSRRRVLRAGLEGGADYMHLVDMDRVLHWAAHYPSELGETVARIPDCDFTIIGRTARALQTHPRNQVETEAIANKVFSLIYGRDVDITAASRGVSREAAEVILRYSAGRFFDSDSEWPTILLCKSDLKIGYIEAEGLEWETRLKRDEMTLPDGRRVDIKEYYEANPESWVYRTMLAHRIARAALNTYREFKG
ncbi:MAG: hypothetical protein NTV61_02690 [Candidatus Bathyarchaeota archaeon]|nr:hypothetical protein [Candidatus Bathyarchaeota archaeon]